MKILHIFDTAGIGSIIARNSVFADKVDLITRNTLFDWTSYGQTCFVGPKRFAFLALKKSLNYDLIHLHSWDKGVPWLKRLRRRIILHYHGSDIRRRGVEKSSRWMKANIVIVATQDLLEDVESARYIPNPVDESLFVFKSFRPPGTAMTISYGCDKEAKHLAKSHGLNLIILPRNIPYKKMPTVLSSYEYYIDVKRQMFGVNMVLDQISKTGLEALACGTKVITSRGEVLKRFPKAHKISSVMDEWKEVYDELII